MPTLATSRPASSKCLRRVTSPPGRSLCTRVARVAGLVDERSMRTLALVVAPLAVVAAACGGGGGGSGAQVQVLRKVPITTAAAGSSRIAVVFGRRASPGTSDGVAFRGTGEVDYGIQRTHVTFSLPAGQAIEAIFDGDAEYVKAGPIPTEPGPGAKPWVKLTGSSAGSAGVGVGQGAATDPAQVVQYLRGAGDVTRVGTETVRGTPTVRYRLLIDLRMAAGGARQIGPGVDSAIKLFGVSTVRAQAWIDDRGPLRKLGYAPAAH